MANITTSIPLSSLPVGVDLSESVDGLFYGLSVATVLFGITVVQAWIYINTNRDKWPLRTLVGLLVLADFTTTCLDTQIMHHYVISNFGNIVNLSIISTPLKIELLVTVMVVLCVEIFFASRVWLIGQFHWILPALILVSAFGAAGAGIATVVAEFQTDSLASLSQPKPRIEVGLDAGLATFSDILATAALCFSFSQSRTGIRRTDTLLQKLFQYTVTRGLFVTLTQTGLLILFLAQPNKLWWMPFHLSLSKAYVITMVAMLNTRNSLRDALHNNGVITDSDMPAGRPSVVQSSHLTGSRAPTGRTFTVASIGGPMPALKENDSFGENNLEMNMYRSRETHETL